MTPPPHIVLKFPTPLNSDIVYKDKSDNCYKYVATEVKCNKSALSQPIIEEFKRKK